MSNYIPLIATITNINQLTAHEKLFNISIEGLKQPNHQPGQFYMVSIFGFGEAPISICSSPDDKNIQLCVRKVGSLTSKLHSMNLGDTFGVRGPYGHGFPVNDFKGKDLLLVAGGLGLAPLRSFIRYIFQHRKDFKDFTLLYGSKKPEDRLFTEEINEWSSDKNVRFIETVDIAEPNWNGNIGLITMLFKFIEPDPKKTMALIIGPPVMYRFVIREMLKKNISIHQIYMDLERRMRCGLGKCGHCQLNGVYVCQQGPVFKYSDMIEWNLKEAL